MPPQHRFYADWSPERILRWAGAIGPEVAALVGKVLDEGEHPEQGFKVALGIIDLHRKYGEERLQRACGRALEFRYHSYRAVKNILANGLDKIEPEQLSANTPIFAAMTTTTSRKNTDEQPSDTGTVMQARLLCVAALSITPLSLGVGQIYVHCAPVT